MYIFLYVVVAVIIIVIILALIAPKSYDVNRSVVINKPLPEVFSYLKLLKNQDNWSPWSEKDPNMKKTFTGIDGEVGFISSWLGNKEVGEGEQEIMKIEPNSYIETELRFLKPFESSSTGFFEIKEAGEGTEVTWGFKGENTFPSTIMMVFMNMDKARSRF